METRLSLLLLIVYLLGSCAGPAAAAEEEDDDEDMDEFVSKNLEGDLDLFHRDRRNPGAGFDLGLPFPLLIGAELEAEWEKVKEGMVSENHGSFDSAEVYLESEPFNFLAVEAEIQWENECDRLTLEELSFEVEPFAEHPWKLEFGRKDVPFGEFESHFISDALPQIVGETVSDLAIICYELDDFELSAGWVAGRKFRRSSSDQFVVDFRYETD